MSSYGDHDPAPWGDPGRQGGTGPYGAGAGPQQPGGQGGQGGSAQPPWGQQPPQPARPGGPGQYGGQGPYGGSPYGQGSYPPANPYGGGGGQIPGGPPGPPFGGPPPRGGGGRPKGTLIIILVVVGVLVLGGLTAGGVAAVRASNDDPTPTPPPTSVSPTPTPSTPSPSPVITSSSPKPSSTVPISNRLDKRSWDKKPLRLKELFPKKYKTGHHHTYKRYAQRRNKSCGKAVRGKTLKKALKKGKCTQVVRATYVDKKHHVVTTVGLANLAGVHATNHARAAFNPGSGIAPEPLNGKKPARFKGKRFLVTNGEDGHYLFFALTTYTNGKGPKSKHAHRALRGSRDMRDLIAQPLLKRKLQAKPD